jgi:hypothetical protein
LQGKVGFYMLLPIGFQQSEMEAVSAGCSRGYRFIYYITVGFTAHTFDRRHTSVVIYVGTEFHLFAPHLLKSESEEQKFTAFIQTRTLKGFAVPRIPQLHT